MSMPPGDRGSSRPRPALFNKLNSKLLKELSDKSSRASTHSTHSVSTHSTHSAKDDDRDGSPSQGQLGAKNDQSQCDQNKQEKHKGEEKSKEDNRNKTKGEDKGKTKGKGKDHGSPSPPPAYRPDPKDSDVENITRLPPAAKEPEPFSAQPCTALARLPMTETGDLSTTRLPNAYAPLAAVPIQSNTNSGTHTTQTDHSTHQTHHYETHVHNYAPGQASPAVPLGNALLEPSPPARITNPTQNATETNASVNHPLLPTAVPPRASRLGALANLWALCSCGNLLAACTVAVVAVLMLMLFLGVLSAVSACRSAVSTVSSGVGTVTSFPFALAGWLSNPFGAGQPPSPAGTSSAPSTVSLPRVTLFPALHTADDLAVPTALATLSGHLLHMASQYGHLATHDDPRVASVARHLVTDANDNKLADAIKQHKSLLNRWPAFHTQMTHLLEEDVARLENVINRVTEWKDRRKSRFDEVAADIKKLQQGGVVARSSRRLVSRLASWLGLESHALTAQEVWDSFIQDEMHLLARHKDLLGAAFRAGLQSLEALAENHPDIANFDLASFAGPVCSLSVRWTDDLPAIKQGRVAALRKLSVLDARRPRLDQTPGLLAWVPVPRLPGWPGESSDRQALARHEETERRRKEQTALGQARSLSHLCYDLGNAADIGRLTCDHSTEMGSSVDRVSVCLAKGITWLKNAPKLIEQQQEKSVPPLPVGRFRATSKWQEIRVDFDIKDVQIITLAEMWHNETKCYGEYI